MKRFTALCTALLLLLPAFAACGTQPDPAPVTDPVVTEPVTDAPLVGEAVTVSPDGKPVWTLLGVENHASFAGLTASENNVIVAVYFEVRNCSEDDVYIMRSCFDTGSSELLVADEEKLPEGVSPLGGLIASGKRRVFCLCFEKKSDWYNLPLGYTPYEGENESFIIMGKEWREKTELLAGNPAYPLDTRSTADFAADLATLKTKRIEKAWGKPSEDTAKQLEATIVHDGDVAYFSNIDYESQRLASWPSASHLTTLKSLISAYGEERIKNDADARANVFALLDYWLKNDPKCEDNWYVPAISVPTSLGYITLMLRPMMSEEQFTKADELIGRGTIRGNSEAVTYTGANLLDMMENTIVHAMLVDDPSLALEASARIASEIKVVKKSADGIQPDGSFFQHNGVLCTAGSYGSVFAGGVADMIKLLNGTAFALPESKVRLFVDHILDGQRYFSRMNGTTYFSISRTAVYAKGANEMRKAASTLSEVEGLYRADEIKSYLESFNDVSKVAKSVKYFGSAYALVNTAPEYFMAVRGAHKDVALTEVVSGQNVLGYNLSYGTTACYMYYGDEYQDIGAVMDLAMFPGTTAYHENEEKLLSRYNSGYNKTWGKKTYTGKNCGGLADEEKGVGAIYMDIINDGITGKLTYITYEGGTIALCAGLNCASAPTEIRTTLDQCKYNGAKANGAPLGAGASAQISDGSAVTNGAFAYYGLDGSTLTAEVNTLTNSYSRNDPAGSTELVTRDVFSLYISHGNKISDGSYAYAVVANSKGDAPANAEKLGIAKITNTEDIQAVEFENGTCVIVFRKAGSYTTQKGETINADKASVVIK